MNSLDWGSSDWLVHGLLLMLVLTVSLLVVAALRRPYRRLFGAEHAFFLWLLPPAVMLASQLPHVVSLPGLSLPQVVFMITSTTAAWPTHVVAATAIDWRDWLRWLWLAGALVSLLLAAWVQRRYYAHLRGAQRVDCEASSWPVLRAASVDVGPALVGAWRSRIVLPADFEERYDRTEQTLILAHEITHARRGDGWWCLSARIVAALFWFNPLAWWALSALRRDQELACDAAVLREHGTSRRRYATAMLKALPSALVLPIGCSWPSRHPVMERIQMLKRNHPGKKCSFISRLLGVAIVVGGSATVYAAQPMPHTYPATRAAVDEALVLSKGAKMAVEYYASHHGFHLPAKNDDAKLPAADLMSGKFVRRVSVNDGVVEVTLRAKPDASVTAGSIRLVPHIDSTRASVTWTCESPDIPSIATLEADCTYHPEQLSSVVAKATPAPSEYQLGMKVALTVGTGNQRHVERTSLAICAQAGRLASASFGDLRVGTTTRSAGHGMVDIKLSVTDYDEISSTGTELHGRLGESLHTAGTGANGKSAYVIDVTPAIGCPARAAGKMVSYHMKNVPARQAAVTIASKAGFELVNPQVLDNAPVTFNFAMIPGDRAIRLIAEVDGKKAVFDGWNVRFEPK